MNLTMKRVAALAALAAMGVAAPVSGASAAITPATLPVASLPGFGLPATGLGLPAFAPAPLSFVGPRVGQVAAVIGPTIITTAPSTFINTNNQVSAGSAVSGGQAAP